MDLSSVMASPSYGKAADTYKKAVAAAATVTTYTVLARSMARELLPHEVRAAARWAVSALLPRRKERRTKTILICRYGEGCLSHVETDLYWDARAYISSRIDPGAMSRVCVTVDAAGHHLLSMAPGDSTTDVFEGVEFTWTLTSTTSRRRRRRGDDDDDDDDSDDGRHAPDTLALSFDAEHVDVALHQYVPFIIDAMEERRRQETVLKIYRNTSSSWDTRSSWDGISHHHPATFDTLAMDPALKQSIIADLDRFLKRKDYYRRIGKAWKRGYLLYGPPGTGKSSLVAAMANYLRFNLYDLDLSTVYSNSSLQKLLTGMPNKSILVIEDIDCCFSTKSREGAKKREHKQDGAKNGEGDSDSDDNSSDSSDERRPPPRNSSQKKDGITLSGLLNVVDGLWSTTGEERIIVFTTNYKDRLDPALLRPGRMDMHIYMGYCCWEAFKTLAKNYFLVDDHALFPEIQELLAEVEVTPAEVSEMLLRSEDVDVALQGFAGFLQGKKTGGRRDGK
ncbi:hypothetical protein ACP70R_004419 [Stipagrostis hirtigluma subsp. patula]